MGRRLLCACRLVDQPMKILIADDQAIFSEGSNRMLSDGIRGYGRERAINPHSKGTVTPLPGRSAIQVWFK